MYNTIGAKQKFVFDKLPGILGYIRVLRTFDLNEMKKFDYSTGNLGFRHRQTV